MLELFASPFVRSQAVLAALWRTAETVIAKGGGDMIIKHVSRHDVNGYIVNARQLRDDASVLGAKVTAGAAGRLARQLECSNGYSMTNVVRLISQTLHFAEELEGKKFLYLADREASLYWPSEPLFGAAVHDQFPGDARYEIEQAGKCLALNLSTAAAFHSIRCLEAGIRALSRCLGVPDPTKAHERSWMKLLAAIKTAVDRKWPTNSDRLAGDGEFFDNAHAALAAIQNPWRNSTMHLDQKYTPTEAMHIFDVVRGLMMKLAFRMDENGLPLA